MRNRLPPLQSLLAFEATARLGTLSRAALELSLTQSAISHQIANLESWVGQALFSRAGRGVKLTAAGELFNGTVRATLKTLRDGRERIEPYRNPDSVILACAPAFASGWLMPRLPRLHLRHPALEMWLITQDELSDIDRIDVDLIISTQRLDSAEMRSCALLEDHALAVCSPHWAQRLRGLALAQLLTQAPLIIDEHRPDWAPWLAELGLATRRAITLDDQRLLLAAAEDGLGIAMVSRLTAAGALAQGRLVALEQPPSFALPSLWLTMSTGEARTPAVKLASDWLCTPEFCGDADPAPH
jgi:LysR family glycine cleavage system transcriptional activator